LFNTILEQSVGIREMPGEKEDLTVSLV